MAFTLAYQVSLAEVFPNENEPSLHKYLSGIPREKVLLVGSGLLAAQFKHVKNVEELLEAWFRPSNTAFAQLVYGRLRPIELAVGNISIANIPAALKLYTYATNNLTDEGNQTGEEIEVNLFKSFLFLNGLIAEVESKITETTENLPFELRWYAMHFTNAIRFNDVINNDIFELFVSEFIRAVYFFEFLEQRQDAAGLLIEFYHVYDVPNWNQYLQQISGLSFSALRKSNAGYLELTIAPGEFFDRDIQFLDRLALITYDELTDHDFKVVRERPLHKIEQGKYRIIFDVFCIERVFKGLYFILKQINENLPQATKVNSFRNLYTYNFSEHHLLFSVLLKAFPRKYLRISGKSIASAGYQGGPDFYVRFQNKAFLFESKDSLINAAIKETGDFTLLQTDLTVKFYKDGNSPKAVLQLLNNILDIYSDRFKEIDNSYKTEFLRVYPILVVHDRQLNVVGFNKIINYWFQIELNNKLAQLDVSRVKPITVIDMSTLLLTHELLNARQLMLEELIDQFHSFTQLRSNYRSEAELTRHAHDTNIPFSFFIKQVIRQRKLPRYPKKLLKEKSFIGLG